MFAKMCMQFTCIRLQHSVAVNLYLLTRKVSFTLPFLLQFFKVFSSGREGGEGLRKLPYNQKKSDYGFKKYRVHVTYSTCTFHLLSYLALLVIDPYT